MGRRGTRVGFEDVNQREHGLILQPLAHGQVGDHRDTLMAQVASRTDTRAEQHRRAAVDTRRQEDFSRLHTPAVHQAHGGGAQTTKFDPVHRSLRADGEIRAGAHFRRQVNHGGVLANAVHDVFHFTTHPVLMFPVEIFDEREARRHGRFKERADRRGEFVHPGWPHGPGTGPTVPPVLARRRVLQMLVSLEHLGKRPPGQPVLLPPREVAGAGAPRDARVDGRTAAEHPAGIRGDAVSGLAGHALVSPGAGRFDGDDAVPSQIGGVSIRWISAACLQEQHRAAGVLAQAAGQHAACRAAADDDDIVAWDF